MIGLNWNEAPLTHPLYTVHSKTEQSSCSEHLGGRALRLPKVLAAEHFKCRAFPVMDILTVKHLDFQTFWATAVMIAETFKGRRVPGPDILVTEQVDSRKIVDSHSVVDFRTFKFDYRHEPRFGKSRSVRRHQLLFQWEKVAYFA